jgi:hypothetical protein
VDTIILNCGEQVRDLILCGHAFLDRKTVAQISRTAPPRQRFEMEQLTKGRRPLRGAAPVFDTVDFGEVISRLRRASGMVCVSLCVTQVALATEPPTAEECDDIGRVAGAIGADATELARLVRAAVDDKSDPGGSDTTKYTQRPSQRDNVAPKRPGYRGALGRLNQAHSWVHKSVRDLPQLVKQITPIRRESDDIERRVARIIDDLRTILGAIGALGKAQWHRKSTDEKSIHD